MTKAINPEWYCDGVEADRVVYTDETCGKYYVPWFLRIEYLQLTKARGTMQPRPTTVRTIIRYSRDGSKVNYTSRNAAAQLNHISRESLNKCISMGSWYKGYKYEYGTMGT